MLKHNLGYPRIGDHRELKKNCEKYWAGSVSKKHFLDFSKKLRKKNWEIQKDAGLDLIPCNDFSFYDHVLDMSFLLGAIPHRYFSLLSEVEPLDLYFSMARGYQKNKRDIPAMEMTKWFDSNYHYIVPEFSLYQTFFLFSKKIFDEFIQAQKILGKKAKPVLIGPISYLLLGKEKQDNFYRIDLISRIITVYIDVLNNLKNLGAEWIQLDEPFLSFHLTEKDKKAFLDAYQEIKKHAPELKIILSTYFESIDLNIDLAFNLRTEAIHVDLIQNPNQLDVILKFFPKNCFLSLGVVDGRNIWKNDYTESIKKIKKAKEVLGEERLMLAPSCSLIHVPMDLDFEYKIHPYLKERMAFAKQKLKELYDLDRIIKGETNLLQINKKERSKKSAFINNKSVKDNVKMELMEKDLKRKNSFKIRKKIQKKKLILPNFPTTTIGSFPQTPDLRSLRYKFKNKLISQKEYNGIIKKFIKKSIKIQEEIGLDVLVHGEFERNDMVEYFGEQLNGVLSTKNGWVQSYGSRCVKPPIIYGDVSRVKDITVYWSSFAKSLTIRPIKGILTGPVTILQWSFVRNDQNRSLTALEIAWAIRDEVQSLERAGIQIIQIDEPALREGLPLKKEKWENYFDWAIQAFHISSNVVKDETQIHTHMCYSEFNDILEYIANMDVDVISIENARSHMELLKAFYNFKYPNEIGPGIYDIHSSRIPSIEEMCSLLEKASVVLSGKKIWVNPDCGLKTRKWPESIESLKNMVKAAQIAREKFLN